MAKCKAVDIAKEVVAQMVTAGKIKGAIAEKRMNDITIKLAKNMLSSKARVNVLDEGVMAKLEMVQGAKDSKTTANTPKKEATKKEEKPKTPKKEEPVKGVKPTYLEFDHGYRTERPTAVKHIQKELDKFKVATQSIAGGAVNSTARFVGKMFGSLNGTGVYTSKDIIYLSTNGSRKGRVAPIRDGKLQGVYTNVGKAIAVGASFVADSEAHLGKTGKYNVGEIELASYLTSKGYIRVDKGTYGLWVAGKPEGKSSTITLGGIAIPYKVEAANPDRPLATTNVKTGEISIQEGITTATMAEYLSQSEDGNVTHTAATRRKVLTRLKKEYGVNFNDVIKDLNADTNNQLVRKFLLLHEYRHTLQLKKSGKDAFKKSYLADPVKFELDADLFALKALSTQLPSIKPTKELKLEADSKQGSDTILGRSIDINANKIAELEEECRK